MVNSEDMLEAFKELRRRLSSEYVPRTSMSPEWQESFEEVLSKGFDSQVRPFDSAKERQQLRITAVVAAQEAVQRSIESRNG
jgi:hypothetical protein